MEAITKVDLNFTNQSAGQTAQVTTVDNVKNLDGTNLGSVIGEAGEVNSFSNPDVNRLLSRFVCTSITKTRDAVKETTTRNYKDKTSLMLKSQMLLVRGQNCSPRANARELDYDFWFPHFNEVKGSPIDSFPVLEPMRTKTEDGSDGSVIVAGKIYNIESATQWTGKRCSLVFNNKDIVEDLSLNLDWISLHYQNNPDLAQFSLKLGYTLDDFKKVMDIAKVDIEGLPTDAEGADRVLFNASGTLDQVLSAIAAYFGYFWFIDPETGVVKFANTETVSQEELDDYTGEKGEKDEKLTTASFTRSLETAKVVNVYTGSTEKPEKQGGEQSKKDDDRPRRMFFKRVYFERNKAFRGILGFAEIGAFFALFNQEESQEVFDLYSYLLIYGNTNFTIKKAGVKEEQESFFKKKIDFEFDLEELYDYEPSNGQTWAIYKTEAMADAAAAAKAAGDSREMGWMFSNKKNAERKEKKNKTQLKGFDRVKDNFKYKRLNYGRGTGKPMPRPSKSKLYEYLKVYFAMAGGVYISNGYGQYKAERMEFQNTNDITVLGPYKPDEKIRDIKDLSTLNDFLQMITQLANNNANAVTNVTIRDLAESSNGEAVIPENVTNMMFFVALRTIPKLEKKNAADKDKDDADQPVDFTWLEKYVEIASNFNGQKGRALFIGGPSKDENGNPLDFMGLLGACVFESIRKYLAITKQKKSIGLKYLRSKTRVKKQGEEDEEEEDNQLSGGGEDGQRMADLLDKVDRKSFAVVQPKWDILNTLTLASRSGSTLEMNMLRDLRGDYDASEDKPTSSSRSIYGLDIPSLSDNLKINSLSLSVGADGITTTISESSVKLIPPDQQLMLNDAQEALSLRDNTPRQYSASQRNFFGL